MGHAMLVFRISLFLTAYAWPFLTSLIGSMLFTFGQRIAYQGRAGLCRRVLALGAGPAVLITGISLSTHTPIFGALYGLGWGTGSALLSYVHTIQLRPFKVVTRKATVALVAIALCAGIRTDDCPTDSYICPIILPS
jgi:hypothetical protein